MARPRTSGHGNRRCLMIIDIDDSGAVSHVLLVLYLFDLIWLNIFMFLGFFRMSLGCFLVNACVDESWSIKRVSRPSPPLWLWQNEP